MRLVSDEYRAQLVKLHEGKWGDEGHLWVPRVRAMALATGSKSILDYGCGKGMLKRALGSEFDIREYDPGIPGKDSDPAPADLLVSTDVLEHVEPEMLHAVLRHMHGRAKYGVMHAVATKGARARLPDGRNAHLIIMPWDWWAATLAEYWPHPRTAAPFKGKLIYEWAPTLLGNHPIR